MSPSTFVVSILRSLIPLGAGWALGRRFGGALDSTAPLARFVLAPALVLSSLLGPQQQRTVVIMALAGVVMALAGYWLVRLLPRHLSIEVGANAATPLVLAFALPWLRLSMGGRPAALAAATVAFLAVALTLAFCEQGEKAFSAIIREPYIYAALAALTLRLAQVPTTLVERAIEPVADASFAFMLVLVGARLPAFSALLRREAWITAGVRLIAGLAVALPVVMLIDLSATAAQALVAVGLAPAALGGLGFVPRAADRDAKGESARAAALAGTLLALIGLVVTQLLRH